MAKRYNEMDLELEETLSEPVETETKEVVKETKKSKAAKAIVKCSALNVRSMAETTASVLEIVNADTELKVLNGGTEVNGFVAVETPNGKNGFVMKQFVEIK